MTRVLLAALAVACLAMPASAATCQSSWYGGGEYLNAKTANGERFRPAGMTAAHRTLKMGTKVRVRYRGKSVVVRINDRGPHAKTGRCLDLSRGAAARLGFIRAGVVTVKYEIIR